jgi:hypothetical protein
MGNAVQEKWRADYDAGWEYWLANECKPAELLAVIIERNADFPLLSDAEDYNRVKSWIMRYKKEKARLTEGRINLAKEFQWQDMGAYGIPWEASGWVIQTLERERLTSFHQRTLRLAFSDALERRERVRSGFNPSLGVTASPVIAKKMVERHGLPPKPTFSALQVVWWWRIHALAPDFTSMLCIAIGNECHRRDIEHELHGGELDISDVQAYCAFHTAGGLGGEAYRDAVELGYQRDMIRLRYLTSFYADKSPEIERGNAAYLASVEEAKAEQRSRAQKFVEDFPR